MKFTIPSSIEEAGDCLNGIGQLLTAKGWERAAIVASFVELNRPHNGKEGYETGHRTSPMAGCEACATGRRHGTVEFANHKFYGLRTDKSVVKWANIWLHGAEEDAEEDPNRSHPEPGQEIEYPDIPWDEMKVWQQPLTFNLTPSTPNKFKREPKPLIGNLMPIGSTPQEDQYFTDIDHSIEIGKIIMAIDSLIDELLEWRRKFPHFWNQDSKLFDDLKYAWEDIQGLMIPNVPDDVSSLVDSNE